MTTFEPSAKATSSYVPVPEAGSFRNTDDRTKHYVELYDAKNAPYITIMIMIMHQLALAHVETRRWRVAAHPAQREDVQLSKKLGKGAFGIVYKGKWHGKAVAVKQVKTGVIGGDKAVAEFEAEVSTMANIPFHENLVQLHGVTLLENGDLAAVVEFCANGALVSELYGDKARADWTVDALLRIAHGAACGVAHLHRVDFVHRDIAARNVLLTKHDAPKVADFGMARLVDDETYEQQTVNPVGPLKWMAPEQMERRAYSKA
jgi:serine/threonine protein kinase